MHKICFTVSLFHTCTCFEHHVPIVRRSKLCYTASGVITPSRAQVERGLQSSLNLCTDFMPDDRQIVVRFLAELGI